MNVFRKALVVGIGQWGPDVVHVLFVTVTSLGKILDLLCNSLLLCDITNVLSLLKSCLGTM